MSAPEGGVCSWGVSAPGGVCSRRVFRGVFAPGGVCSGGGAACSGGVSALGVSDLGEDVCSGGSFFKTFFKKKFLYFFL